MVQNPGKNDESAEAYGCMTFLEAAKTIVSLLSV